MDPELIPEWYGPRDIKTVVEEMDVRTGGELALLMSDPDGNVVVFRGTYREMTAPERIVQTFEWDGMPGYVSVGPSDVHGPR